MTLFADCETTGKIDFRLPEDHPCQPDLVQIAAVLCDDEGRVSAQFEFLVSPQGWTIPDEAAAIHGYTTEFCEAHGLARKQVLQAFNMLCRRADVLVAHNLDFDRAVIRTNLLRCGLPLELDRLEQQCTMKVATPICKLPGKYQDYKWPSLAEAHKHFLGSDLVDAHSALADALACARIYWAMRQSEHVCNSPLCNVKLQGNEHPRAGGSA